MYNLPYFRESDEAVVRTFIREHPFAVLIGTDTSQKPVATQVPVFIDERDGKLVLSGHIMRNTDHHRAFEHQPEVLVLFSGPHTHVSASWYSNPQQGSTWNYQTVHARGRMRFGTEEELLRILQRTTDHFEANPDSGANFRDLPRTYIDKMINAIVAFEIEVYDLQHVFKLSQNRDEESYDNIIEKLTAKGGDAALIAQTMKERKAKVFSEKTES